VETVTLAPTPGLGEIDFRVPRITQPQAIKSAAWPTTLPLRLRRQTKSIIKTLRNFEEQLKAPEGSLATLPFLDDWSMVIKAHALVEGAVSQLLAAALDQRLQGLFSRLELGHEVTGKLEFCKALGLLTSSERGFVRKLSEVRNKLAHDHTYLSFTFDGYIAKMEKKQRTSFYESVLFEIPEASRDGWLDFMKKTPKPAVGLAAMRIVSSSVAKVWQMGIDARESELQMKAGAVLLHEIDRTEGNNAPEA
jgi:hypothetical protein